MSALLDAVEALLESMVDSSSNQEVDAAHLAYDNVVWAAVTAEPSDLAGVAARLWDEPYIRTPAPLIVLIQRLAGLEAVAAGDREAARVAAHNIMPYCDPIEEQNAVATLLGHRP